MQKKKLAILVLAAMTANMSVTPVSAFTATKNLKMVQLNQKESIERGNGDTTAALLDDNESEENLKSDDDLNAGKEDNTIKDQDITKNEQIEGNDGDTSESQDKAGNENKLDDENESNNEQKDSDEKLENEDKLNNEDKTQDKTDSKEEAENEAGSEEEIQDETENAEEVQAQLFEAEVSLNSVQANVEKFKLYGSRELKEYDNAFKVQRSEIVSFRNNGSQYADCSLDKAFDNDIYSHFETGTPNGHNFKNEIVVTFDELKTLNRVVYAARQDYADGKGFARKALIYASTSASGDDFSLVCSGEYDGWAEDVVEIKFNPTKFKRLKFVFDEADEDWASCSELWFYKEDKIEEVMKDLFKDSSKYEINEEYNDIDTLNDLQSQIENHPLRDRYIEDINLAKQIISQGVAGEYSESKIRVSAIAKSDSIGQYNEAFKISSDAIKNVTNNGGQYGDSGLSKLYDGNKYSHWETGTGNSDSFKNEVVFTFNSMQKIEKLIMSPRQDSWNKGFPLEYEIYGSLSEDGDDFRLITSGKSNSVLSDDFEIVFKESQFKRLKFRFVDVYEDWAALGEVSFYTKDEVTSEINNVFTDNLYSELTEEYSTLEKIQELEARVSNHPLRAEYMEIINLAKSLLNGSESVVSGTITLSQRGNEDVKRNELRQCFAGGNLDVTGFYVMPGESFEVYVDADPDGKMPQVAFAQVGEIDDSGNQRRNLTIGKNVVTAPQGTKAFAIYFTNRALPEEQSYAPKVKLSGENLKSYPVYIQGKTDPAQYIEAVRNHTGANMTDIAGERYLLSVQNSEAVIAYVDRGYSPDKTDEDMKKFIASFDRLAGYDVNDEKSIHRPSQALYHYKAANDDSMFAVNEYIYYPGDTARDVLSGYMTDWGFVHEFAHQIENADMEIIEVTNNIYSTYVQRELGKTDIDYAALQKNVDKFFTYNEGTKGFGGFGEFNLSFDFELGLFERLIVLDQIFEYFGDNIYGQANRLLRENPDKYNKAGYKQNLIMTLSEASGYDLSSHFEYYNYPVTDAAKAFTSQFKPLDKKIRYISMLDYKKAEAGAEVFTQDTKAVIEGIKRESDGFTLTLNTSNNNDAMSAYEIYRDGEFVGFTRSNTYKDNADVSREYTYEVIAYDYRANESIKSDAVNTAGVSYRPELKGYDSVTIAVNEEFNPLAHVSAFTYDGEAIGNENIIVLENNVDNTKAGSYKVKYQVEDRGNKSEKTITVKVVNRYDYLSDNEWTSVRTDWGTPRRNSDIKGRVNGEITSFAKGFGIHANGEIVYELGEHNYDTFEAFVGVDMLLQTQENSSIKFKITVDGEVLEETDMIKHADNMIFISVSVKGVKELKIEVLDGDNGNTSDHGIIVNPILIANDSAPDIDAEEKVSVSLSDMAYESAYQGWGQLGIDKSVDGNAIRLTGENKEEVVYQKGLGTHTNSTIVYDLNGKDYDSFSAYVGVDREAYNTWGSVQFKVYLDGVKAFDSGVMRSTDSQKHVELSVKGVSKLMLVVTDGGDGDESDHADWADAKLYKKGSSTENISDERAELKELVEQGKAAGADMTEALKIRFKKD